MKPLSTLTLLSLFLLCIMGGYSYQEERKPDCMRYISMFPECILPSKPVCGTNGITYKNECQLCVTNWKSMINVRIRYNGEC
ncbi:trypsin inhibitor ClTI-1-like isoform X2 [Scyliorhinus canicula]|uniref:trypsin inhibitor ClTI-1-like isoform X2 n=1 Tax=Scyliorhinus canicula TaxID=7830 RepID=UPI0018F5A243|nr:trypsin inhibitor ClTI-1-like isoform X2 [Scyliorhinus canicula]